MTYTGGRDAHGGALVEHDGREGESLLRLEGSLDEDDGKSRLEMPLDVAMDYRRESVSERLGWIGRGGDVRIQVPGLSATNRMLTAPPEGMVIVSLLMGLAAPSV